MKKTKLLDAMGSLDEEIIERYFQTDSLLQRKKLRKRFLNWGCAAACVLLIASAVLIRHSADSGEHLICDFQPSSESQADYAYAAPLPGEMGYSARVGEALDAYDGSEVFLMTFDMFKSDGGELTDAEKTAEYSRLSALGYELYTVEAWTYYGQGSKKYYEVVVISLTEEELLSFESSDEYGYFFRFVRNGDSSPISVADFRAISDFDSVLAE